MAENEAVFDKTDKGSPVVTGMPINKEKVEKPVTKEELHGRLGATSTISTPVQVSNANGRIGVCLYDNPAITNNYQKSAYVIWGDGTYSQIERIHLTTMPGLPAFFRGVGPGN